MAAIIGAIREQRIAVLITGSLTLIMFLSLLFTNKENKNINVSLFTLLAIAAQSLIFSEMLKERQLISQRQNIDFFSNLSSNRAGVISVGNNRRTTSTPLTAVVVYQPPGSNQGRSSNIFMVDPISGTELPKDPPPSYFAASCPPPKYEDTIKLDANSIVQNLRLNVNSSERNSSNENPTDQQQSSTAPSSPSSSTDNPQPVSDTSISNQADVNSKSLNSSTEGPSNENQKSSTTTNNSNK